MMRLRRASVMAALSLLAWAATVSAERREQQHADVLARLEHLDGLAKAPGVG